MQGEEEFICPVNDKRVHISIYLLSEKLSKVIVNVESFYVEESQA